MKDFFRNLGYKIQQWMQGRYGVDELSKTLIITSVSMLFLSTVPVLRFLYPLSLALMVWCYIRCFSRNIQSRRDELNTYYIIKNKINNKIALRKRMRAERKTHKYFKCKNCGAVLRVPKGKGKIEITCNVCKCKIIKKS